MVDVKYSWKPSKCRLCLLLGHEEAKCKAVKRSSAVGNPPRKIALPKCRPLSSSSSADLPFEVDCPGLAGKVFADSLMKAPASASSPVQVIAGNLEMIPAPATPRASALSLMVDAVVCDSLNGKHPKDVDCELVFEAPAGADQELPEKSGSGAKHPLDSSLVVPGDDSLLQPHHLLGHLESNVPPVSYADSLKCGLGVPPPATDEFPKVDSVDQSSDAPPLRHWIWICF
ncbi:hypothetical protein Nepgr_021689 [Nepenthes gracilis]|uniref:Uncharacterized protein n=1 Tax=Nepenthes gracilis TaxID=150966 RepID=A0AAD3SX79_NEPGR|nr:hypothetical protein Nepgr_021689 [Nepenthes gracilis]